MNQTDFQYNKLFQLDNMQPKMELLKVLTSTDHTKSFLFPTQLLERLDFSNYFSLYKEIMIGYFIEDDNDPTEWIIAASNNSQLFTIFSTMFWAIAFLIPVLTMKIDEKSTDIIYQDIRIKIH